MARIFSLHIILSIQLNAYNYFQVNSTIFLVVFQGSAYVPRDELVSLVANEFRMQLSRALAVSAYNVLCKSDTEDFDKN